MYDDEEAHCYFDLTLDLLNGDLKKYNYNSNSIKLSIITVYTICKS